MSHFYAEIQGNRGMGTRCGTKGSGIRCHIRGWDIGVAVRGEYDPLMKEDYFIIYMTDGSNGYGKKVIGEVQLKHKHDGSTNVVFVPSEDLGKINE